MILGNSTIRDKDIINSTTSDWIESWIESQFMTRNLGQYPKTTQSHDHKYDHKNQGDRIKVTIYFKC